MQYPRIKPARRQAAQQPPDGGRARAPTLLLHVDVLPALQRRQLVPDLHRALPRNRHHLHAETSDVRPRARVHVPEAAQRAVGLRGVAFAGGLVDVGQLAARRPAGDGVLVEANLDALPGVFDIGLWASD